MENDAMGEDLNETAAEPSGVPSPAVTEAAAFTALTDLLAVIADPREHKRRLRGYHEALVAADEAQKRLLSAQSEFEVYQTKVRAELTKREQSAVVRETAAIRAEASAAERGRGLIEQAAELRRADAILKRRTMVLARLDAVDERMQALPTWKEISGALLNAESLDLVDEMDAVTEQPAGMPAAVTLTQTFHRAGRRSTRRLPAEA
jgi:hypothetical protein